MLLSYPTNQITLQNFGWDKFVFKIPHAVNGE